MIYNTFQKVFRGRLPEAGHDACIASPRDQVPPPLLIQPLANMPWTGMHHHSPLTWFLSLRWKTWMEFLGPVLGLAVAGICKVN